MPVVDRVEASEGREQTHIRFGDGVADEVALPGQSCLEPVESLEQSIVGSVVGFLRSGEAGPVHPVVHVAEDRGVDLVDLTPQPGGVEVGRPLAVELGPFARQVESDLRVVVRDDLPARNVDDGGHRDAPRVVGKACEEGLLEPLDSENRVDASRIEVEGPAARVVRRAGHPEADRRLEAEQPPDDHGTVRPRARPRGDEPVATGLDRPAVAGVPRDAILDVVGVPRELLAGLDVTALHGVV